MKKLDIGCGGQGTIWPGFVGVDLWPAPPCPRVPGAEYVRMDFVRDALPWPENSIDEILASHVVEHMTREDGVVMVRRCLALLKPGALLTVACPDLATLCLKLLARDEAFWKSRHQNDGPEIWPGATLADRFNWAVHQEGHRWAYDADSLVRLVREAGCENVRVLEHGDSPYLKRPYCEIGVEVRK